MSDLISRQDAANLLYKMLDDDYIDGYAYLEQLRSLPSVEPERHQGEWIEDGHERGFSECSKCGYIAVSVLSERHYNFCPNCGAKMTRGE